MLLSALSSLPLIAHLNVSYSECLLCAGFIAQKNHDLSLENFMQTVGYTYLYPKRNEKCAYFSVAVLPMTG